MVEFIKSKKRPDAVLERGGRRVYLAYPHFRSPSAGLPDSLYLAQPREARGVEGYREGTALLRRVLRKARRMLRAA